MSLSAMRHLGKSAMMMMNMVLAMFQWCFRMRSTTQLDGVAETDVAVHMLKPCMSSTTDFMSCSCLDTGFSTFMFCCSLPRIMMTFCPVKTEKRMIPRSPITSTTSFLRVISSIKAPCRYSGNVAFKHKT